MQRPAGRSLKPCPKGRERFRKQDGDPFTSQGAAEEMARVNLHRYALEQLDEIAEYIAIDNPSAASELGAARP